MNKYFLPVYHSDLKPWIKWWVLKRLNGGESTLKAVTLSEGTLTKVDKSKALRIKEYYGNAIQDGTPTPEAPVEIQTISGDNTFNINSVSYRVDLGGKNKLQPISESQTVNGITFTLNEDKSITLNGTATANALVTVYGSWSGTTIYQTLDKNSYYTISGSPSNDIQLFIRTTNGSTITSHNPYSSPTFTGQIGIVNYFIQVISGLVCDNITLYPQLEKGSVATEYSPYVSNPIELCKIGNYVDKLKRAEGKNYCYTNASEWELGQYGVNGEKTEFPQRARISTLIPVQPNTTIYVHTNNTNYNFVLRGYGQNKEIITNYGQVTNGNTITTTNVYYLGVTIMHISDTSSTAGQTILNNLGETIFPMICLNSEINKSYEPYGNNWYIEKNIGKVILNGTENWANDGGTVGTNYRHNIQVSALGIATPLGTTGNALTDHFKTVTVGNNNQAWGNFYLSSTWLVIQDKDAVYNSKANFVNWLTTNNTELYYVKDTPTTETITNTNLISQLNALYEFYVNSSTVTISNNSEITLEVLLEYYGR